MSKDLTRRQYSLAKHREGIPISLILERLGKCLAGDVEMSAVQLRAAEILLKKAMPDLSSVELSGSVETRNTTAAELTATAKQLGMDPETLFDDPDELAGGRATH